MESELHSVSVISTKPILVGVEDAAKMLGISPTAFKTLHRNALLGPLPTRIPTIKRVLFRADELGEWVRLGMPCRERWQQMREGT